MSRPHISHEAISAAVQVAQETLQYNDEAGYWPQDIGSRQTYVALVSLFEQYEGVLRQLSERRRSETALRSEVMDAHREISGLKEQLETWQETAKDRQKLYEEFVEQLEACVEIAEAAREYVGDEPVALWRDRASGNDLVGMLSDPKWKRLVVALASSPASRHDA